MTRAPLVLGLITAAAAGGAAAQTRPATDRAPFSFVVLGHIRGARNEHVNPKLGELLDRVRALHPDLVILSGDIIWGDVEHNPSRTSELDAEWTAVDSALATLRVPVYRVPGNHDVSDVPSRDVWIRRYGRPPSVVTFRGSRFILLASAFFPPDGDTTHETYVAGVDIDTAQQAFLRRTLAEPGFAHTFVVLGHNLWWQTDAGRWWREVHPLLEGRVDAVFSGDYGPLKFSTMERGGVRYYQCSMETEPSVVMLQNRSMSRILSSQFDNFLEVRVGPDSARVLVHTLAEVSSGMFTPQKYRAIENRPPVPIRRMIAPLLDSWKKKTALALLAAALLGGGAVAGWAVGRRRA